MYLSKNRNNTYYTRVVLPKTLRSKGFQFAVRISLGTKSRSEAIDLNLSTAQFIRNTFKIIPSELTSNQFKDWFNYYLSEFNKNRTTPLKSDVPSNNEGINQVIPSFHQTTFTHALKEFLESKESESISYRSIKKLENRISHFLKWLNKNTFNQVTPRLVMDYRNYLLSLNKSYKTNIEYIAANRQFFKWSVQIEYSKSNPFDGLRLGQRPTTAAHEQRSRWSQGDLNILFSFLYKSVIEKKSKYALTNYYVSLISLYAGLRTSESCQLKVESIKKVDDIYTFEINDVDENTKLKTLNAYRSIPIHSNLIRLGLLEYVNERQRHGKTMLFDDLPFGHYNDWSKPVGSRFYRIFQKLKFEDNKKPTLYGLRHTFIDELQQHEVPEHIVAELSGHSKKGITFGRYGKRLNMMLLKEKVELINFELF
ncbi:MAG: integrase [Psychroserpens sp.]|jgi:integrase